VGARRGAGGRRQSEPWRRCSSVLGRRWRGRGAPVSREGLVPGGGWGRGRAEEGALRGGRGRRQPWRGRRRSRTRGAEWGLGLGWNGEGRSGIAGWRSKKGRRELQRGAHGEVGHGGVAMAAAVARGRASRSSPRLLWASRRRRGAGHVSLGAGRAARAGRAAAAALGRSRSSPSVACAVEREVSEGSMRARVGVMAWRSEAAARWQQ